MFSGSFTQISFGEVLRLLTAAAQNGELVIASKGINVGAVYLSNGQIADAKTASLNSLDAMSDLCSYIDADFNFNQGVQAPSQALLGIPPARIIETIIGRVNQINLIRSFAPLPDESVIYRPSENISKLEATPDELTLLLLADGRRSVEQIARESGKSLDFVQQSLARFRQAGVIDIVKAASTPAPPPTSSFSTPPAAAAPRTEPVTPLPRVEHGALPQSEPPPTQSQPRYWRGKKIE